MVRALHQHVFVKLILWWLVAVKATLQAKLIIRSEENNVGFKWDNNEKEMMKFYNSAFLFYIVTFFDGHNIMVLLLLHHFDPMVKLMGVSFNIMVSNEWRTTSLPYHAVVKLCEESFLIL